MSEIAEDILITLKRTRNIVFGRFYEIEHGFLSEYEISQEDHPKNTKFCMRIKQESAALSKTLHDIDKLIECIEETRKAQAIAHEADEKYNRLTENSEDTTEIDKEKLGD